MASTLTWLDYSERDRRRALDVIDLFGETGTVDELGLAGVGNSYSDLFFPGTSTIQTSHTPSCYRTWTLAAYERWLLVLERGCGKGAARTTAPQRSVARGE